jgi:hypothetical protein
MFNLLTLGAVLSLQLVVAIASNPVQSFFSSNAPRYKAKGNSNPNWRPSSYANANWGSYDAGLFTPLEDFSSLSETVFTTFGHPAFPRHSIRIKKTPKSFCDNTTRFAVFYFYLSCKCNPYLTLCCIFYFKVDTRDTLTSKLGTCSSISSKAEMIPTKILSYFGPTEVNSWTVFSGFELTNFGCIGPGCSSSLGLFMELGPCRISDANGTRYHPESWTENANVFFVDQPIGVGFSYADYGESVVRTSTDSIPYPRI